jgi:hypothetical protein
LRIMVGLTCNWIHYPSDDTERTGHIRFFTFASLRRLAKQEGFHYANSRGVSWRFNGTFWDRAFFWVARPFGAAEGIHRRIMRLDDVFSRVFPGLAPGILMVFSKE